MPQGWDRTGAAPAVASNASPAAGIVLGCVLVLLAFVCGFGTFQIQADISQPVVGAGAPTVDFIVNDSDTIDTIAANLQAEHLIRSATVFTLYLKIKGMHPNIEPGDYALSPSMTLAQIIAALAPDDTPPAPTDTPTTTPTASPTVTGTPSAGRAPAGPLAARGSPGTDNVG